MKEIIEISKNPEEARVSTEGRPERTLKSDYVKSF
uniref:Uncharacterized protein n=1 Tax=Rhizophora mucronata TaxID=61149 RepID=A0A2P2R568_RHIMU